MTPDYGQCGGVDPATQQPWPTNKSCCPPSFICEKQDQYYSQCDPDTSNHTCAGPNDQCGGMDTQQPPKPWGSLPSEKSCCLAGYSCIKDNDYYSGCKPDPVCTNPRFGQCGGIDSKQQPWDKDHGHDTCCPAGFECDKKDQYFSQCNPEKSSRRL